MPFKRAPQFCRMGQEPQRGVFGIHFLIQSLDGGQGHAAFVPARAGDLALLLTFYQLEKVIYEIAYELNNRPDWVEIPLRGLAAIVTAEGLQT